MNRQDAEKWVSISAAVRAAFLTGNYAWTRSFDQAYYSLNKINVDENTFKKGPFAIEPVAAPKNRTAIHMLLFFESGYIFEGELTDETGRVTLTWLHTSDWRNRPIVSLPLNTVQNQKRSYAASNARPVNKTIAKGLASEAVSDVSTPPSASEAAAVPVPEKTNEA